MNPLLVSLLPLIGAAVGITLQYFFSRSTEAKKQLLALRNQAYVDYLRAVAQSAHALVPDDAVKARLLAADAKSRIVVYGDPLVVRALAEFERLGPRLDQDASLDAFVQLAATMRTDGARVDLRSIELLLIGTRRTRNAKSSSQSGASSKTAALEQARISPHELEPSTSIENSDDEGDQMHAEETRKKDSV